VENFQQVKGSLPPVILGNIAKGNIIPEKTFMVAAIAYPRLGCFVYLLWICNDIGFDSGVTCDFNFLIPILLSFKGSSKFIFSPSSKSVSPIRKVSVWGGFGIIDKIPWLEKAAFSKS